MAKTIKRVLQSAAIDGGHAIQVVLEMTDGSRETIRCETHSAPSLVQALIQASAVAEKQRQSAPRQNSEVEAPYHATSVRVGSAIDGQGANQIGVKFATDRGVPVMVSMSPSLAQEAIDKLSEQIDRLDRQPPRRTN